MRTLLTSLLLMACTVAVAQTPPNFIPRVNGGGTNTFLTNSTMIGSSRIGSGNLITNPVAVGPITGDGLSITNVLEKNIAVTTNNWSTADVDFSRGTSIERTLSGNLSISGISGFVTSNLNWQTIAFLPDGADRVIDVPNSWLVAGFTNATTVTLPATNVGILRVEGVIGRRTNASFEIYFP